MAGIGQASIGLGKGLTRCHVCLLPRTIATHNRASAPSSFSSINFHAPVAIRHVAPAPNTFTHNDSQSSADDMPPARTNKRSSDEMEQQSTMSQRQMVSAKAGTPPMLSSSPGKRQRLGISLEQKQAIIDNLQLESQ